MAEGIGVGSLSSLNLCGDPRGVRFGTAHFQVALEHWVTLGWCRQWRHGKGVHFAFQWIDVLPPPPRAPYMTPPHTTGTRGGGGGHAEHHHRVCPVGPPYRNHPRRAQRLHGGPVAAPTASTHFRTAMELSRRQERRLVLRYVCLFAGWYWDFLG